MNEAETKRVCSTCGKFLSPKYRKDVCRKCRISAWLHKNGPYIALAGLFAFATASALSHPSDSSNNIPVDISDTNTVPDNSGRQWNAAHHNWELDGKPYTYRVSYFDRRDNQIHTHDYSDVEDSYEDYKYYCNQYWAKDVTHDHIPPSEF